jgi:phenylacetate-CoA ligase
VPPAEIVRIHASSGTTGKPTVVGYTKRDIGIWAEVMARTLTAAGASRQSFIQVATATACSPAAWRPLRRRTCRRGPSSRFRAATPPADNAHERLRHHLLACTPSYALYIAETLGDMGLEPKDSRCGRRLRGRPWSERMRKEIEARLSIKAIDIYGLSEIIGPGVASECDARKACTSTKTTSTPKSSTP